MMKIILLILISCCALYAQETQETTPALDLMHRRYDMAFEFYGTKEYSKAIEQWTQVLQIDPKQVTAAKMIKKARKKLRKTGKGSKAALDALIAKGNYRKALLKIYELLDQYPNSAFYQKLQYRLEKLTRIVPQLPGKNKAWRIVGMGIKTFLSKTESSRFAYDTLRYARDIDSKDSRIWEILSFFESEHPKLIIEYGVPPEVNLLEYKKNAALRYIYDGKYHLAIKELNSILILEPNDVTALKRIGSAYFQLNDKARAKKAWRKAYKLSPKDSRLKKWLQ